jgi:hypothetical protein
MPGISLNWRRTSATISAAALPTALIACELNKKGIMAPMKPATNTAGLDMLNMSIDEFAASMGSFQPTFVA